MSDDKNVNDGQEQSTDQNIEKNTQEQDSGENWQSIAGVDPSEFDSPAKLAKSYKDARKGLSEQGQKIKQYEQDFQKVVPVLQAINSDPELSAKVRERLTGQPQEKGTQKQKETNEAPQPVTDPRVNDLVASKQEETISSFESEFDVSNMSEEDASEFRESIKTKLMDWGYNNQNTPPISKLKSLMTDAAIASGYKRPEKEESSDVYGFGTPRVYSGPTEAKGIKPNQLSAAQKKAAEKMGMTLEEYAKELQVINSQ